MEFLIVLVIVTLGLQGSGKTLLLTGIYRRLQVPGDRGFYLRAPYVQLIELNRWYRESRARTRNGRAARPEKRCVSSTSAS
jgi:hypothetical protein